MRFIILCLLILLSSIVRAYPQNDSTAAVNPQYHTDSAATRPHRMAFLDSVALASTQRQQFISDSEAMVFVMPDSNRVNEYTNYILKNELYHGYTFLDIPYHPKKNLGDGHTRKSRDPWIMILIAGILIYTAFLNITLGADVKIIFQSFFSKRVERIDKEDRQINFWTFIGLFLLFSSTFALFLYQLAAYNGVYYSLSGVQLFSALALIIICLFLFKFLILKILGFLFDINGLVSEYITTLYLTYFNIAFVFLPVVICFSLLAAQLIPYLLIVALVLIVIIFVWIYLRSSVNIISNFRFHKFYLFIYLCALEICPILILIKVLNL